LRFECWLQQAPERRELRVRSLRIPLLEHSQLEPCRGLVNKQPVTIERSAGHRACASCFQARCKLTYSIVIWICCASSCGVLWPVTIISVASLELLSLCSCVIRIGANART